MQVRQRRALLAAAFLAASGVTAAASSADAASPVRQATTTVQAQPSGGYITTYTDVNGNVTKVYAALPVTVTLSAPTSRQITVDDATVTEHTAGVSVTPQGTIDKSAITAAATFGSTITPYEELLAMGAHPADVASFKDTSTITPATSGSGGGTQIGPPVCVDQGFDGSHGHVHGCDVTRRVGASGQVWYLTDEAESTATLHDTGCQYCDHLTGLKFGLSYGGGNTIQHWLPSGTQDVGSCVSNTVSLSFHGVGVSSTGTQCPATFGVYTSTSTAFSTKWDGQGHGPNNGARDTHAVDAVYNGASASPYPGVNYTVWYTTT
jgi:hypothetical protein